ncbi:MAG: GyrI-like domain-containing protein [Bacteroidetes bacterium]|nr:GyrI-like domain-containing protein [Bacteroidota bacterium]
MNQPIIKKIKPINFLFHRAEVKISDLINQVPVAKDLFKESVRLDLHPSGPIHWHYFGFMGDETKPFTLEVCLPTASIPTDYDGAFHLKRTEDFKCVSLLHQGAWHEIPKSYGILMEFMQQHQLQPTGITRELYINADFVNPEANVTEIQMGIN